MEDAYQAHGVVVGAVAIEDDVRPNRLDAHGGTEVGSWGTGVGELGQEREGTAEAVTVAASDRVAGFAGEVMQNFVEVGLRLRRDNELRHVSAQTVEPPIETLQELRAGNALAARERGVSLFDIGTRPFEVRGGERHHLSDGGLHGLVDGRKMAGSDLGFEPLTLIGRQGDSHDGSIAHEGYGSRWRAPCQEPSYDLAVEEGVHLLVGNQLATIGLGNAFGARAARPRWSEAPSIVLAQHDGKTRGNHL